VEKFCQHIEKLLAQHDYVVVPNLGGFVVQMQSAQITPDCITPPHATVSFNPLMHHADGLLAIEIARSNQISYRLAMEYIEKEVAIIKSQVTSKNSIQLGNLGTFNLNETGTLIFAPSKKTDFLPQNFQLSNLHISTKDSRKVENKKKVTITLPSTRLFKYAAAAMVIFGLFFASPKVNDMRRQSDTASLANLSFKPRQVRVEVAKPDIKDSTIDSDSTKIAKTEKSADTPTIIENKITEEASSKFHVIVASSSTKEAAERYCKELVGDEFPNTHVLPPAKTYRVAIQSFSNREEAIEFMQKLRETDSRFESAWVLCN
jgi:nucleoid DNA-binding protein